MHGLVKSHTGGSLTIQLTAGMSQQVNHKKSVETKLLKVYVKLLARILRDSDNSRFGASYGLDDDMKGDVKDDMKDDVKADYSEQ